MNETSKKAGTTLLPACLALLMLVGFHALVLNRMSEDPTSLGYHAVEVSPGYGRFLGAYLFFGLAATVGLVLALYRGLIPRHRLESLKAQLLYGSDPTFVVAASLLAFALGCLSYRFLLLGMPVTDDEGAYRFAAQLLAKGRLHLPSDPDKDFFDHVFLVNDGRVFTQYFLGWPALMLPALLLGIEGYANAAYFALTIPAIFLILRRLGDSFWARLGTLLTLSSPMLLISAGTLLSHTSCMAALAWGTYCALRCRDREASWVWHTLFALALSLAFCIRPLTAAGLGLPLLFGWLWDLRGHPGRGKALAALAAPALLAAAVFVWVNIELNGSLLRTGYGTFLGYRIPDRAPFPEEKEFAFFSLGGVLSQSAAAFQRLGFAALGWPNSWLFVFFAGAAAGRRLLLAMIPCFFALHLTMVNVGVDTYAPLHYFELALPMVVLTVLGIENTARRARCLDQALEKTRGESCRLASLPLLVAAASVLINLGGLCPYQLDAAHKTALLEKISRSAAEQLPQPAVIFVKQPYYTRDCFPSKLKSWVHQWPINDPDLTSEVIWLAHVSLARDRELMARRFPARQAFLVAWQSCNRIFVPLEGASESDFPPVNQRVKL